MTPFDLQSFVLSLVASGGLAMLVSGWIAVRWTHATDAAMLIQTWLVAIAIAFLASLIHTIPVPPSDVWEWIKTGFVNGVLSNILYQLGIFRSLMAKLKALTPHQQEAP